MTFNERLVQMIEELQRDDSFTSAHAKPFVLLAIAALGQAQQFLQIADLTETREIAAFQLRRR